MTNIDLALKLRDAAWWPPRLLKVTDPKYGEHAARHVVEDNLDRIFAAAVVALWNAGWICIKKPGESIYGWAQIEDDVYRESDTPLRATLLAAVEMESAK